MREFILRTYTDDESETCKKCGLQEVVRCKDCKYYLNDMGHCLNDLINAWMSVNPNWYCANGERDVHE